MPTLEEDKRADGSSSEFDDIANNSLSDQGAPDTSTDDFDKIISDNYDPEEIAGLEKQASEGMDGASSDQRQGASEQQSLDNKVNYTGGNSGEPEVKGQSSFSRKKAFISMGMLMLLSGGGFGLFGLLAQPLQLLQLSRFLQQAHFSSGENVGDTRMTKVGRYLRYGGDERTRLGVIGNKYANRLETRLNRSGLVSTYDNALKTFSGYDVDTEKVKNSTTLGDLDGKSPEQIKEALKKRFNLSDASIKINPDTGKIRITPDGTLAERRMLRAALQEAGYSKVGAAMRARIMGKRAGTTWSPVKKLDRKIISKVDDIFKTWKANRAASISDGAGLEFDAKPQEKTNPETGETDTPPDNDAAARETESVKTDPETGKVPTDPEARVKTVKSNLLAKTGLVSAAVGITCLVNGLAEQYDSVKHENVVLPLMRMGVERLAVGNQIITGQSLDTKQVDYMTKLMYDPETKTSWTSAKSVQHEMGKPLTGTDINPEARVSSEGNIFSEALDKLVVVGAICDGAASVVGQIAFFAIDVVSGPISALVTFAIQPALGYVFEGFVRWIAGNPINVEVAGANYGNYVNYGARLAANDAAIAGGGTKLSPAQVAELRAEEKADQQYQFSQKSLYAKIFDASDYRTVTGRFMMQQIPDPMQNIARAATFAPRSIGSIFGSFGNLLGSSALASEEYDYGFDKYGFSLSDQESSLVENPFENNEVVADLLDADTSSKIKNKTVECFNIDIVKQTIPGVENPVWAPVSLGSVPAYKDIPDECSSNKEDWWLRVRMWIQDTQLMGAFGCFEDGEDGTCDEFGLSASGADGSTVGDYKVGIQSLDCTGFKKLSSSPANIVNGQPTNVMTIDYEQKVSAVCQTVKDQCIAGVAGTIKALCAALEFHDSWYGNQYSDNDDGVLLNQANYGFAQVTNGLYNPVKWYESRKPGLNGYNLLECSALTTVAVYKAFGYTEGIGCSGNWGASSRPQQFKDIQWSEVRPGDFLTYSKQCNQGSGFGHIAIAASSVDANGDFVVFHQNQHGSTANFRLHNKDSWGVQENEAGEIIPFDGHLSRWIGQGAN